jgi:hypothetical protein
VLVHHLLHDGQPQPGAALGSRPTAVMLIQSAKLSPTVVHRILITQNQIVTSGTLLSIRRTPGLSRAELCVIRETVACST